MSRGDVVRMPGDRRVRGRVRRGARYGIVVQSARFELPSTVLVAPTSRSVRRASFRPRAEVAGSDTMVLTEQLRALDASALGDPVGRVTPAEMEEIDDALRLVLDLPRR